MRRANDKEPKMEPKIVVTWTTKSGLPAMIVLMPRGFHCGYVGVDTDHPVFGKDYDDELLDNIEVHGGLTYAGDVPQTSKSRFWAFGYDCAHVGDAISPANEDRR